MSASKEPTKRMANLTPMSRHGEDAPRMVEGAIEGGSSSEGDATLLAEMRASYAEEGEPVGTMPPPATLKQGVKAVGQALAGKDPNVLLDKLAERLAFERSGVRLYDAFVGKVELDDADGVIDLEEARRFRDEEHQHFRLVHDAIERLGGDPTAVTPCANVTAVASMGLVQVATDPRTTTVQALHAIHVAELADNDGWQALVELADAMGQAELSASFRQALAEEDEHLDVVRDWMSQAVHDMAGVERVDALAGVGGTEGGAGGEGTAEGSKGSSRSRTTKKSSARKTASKKSSSR